MGEVGAIFASANPVNTDSFRLDNALKYNLFQRFPRQPYQRPGLRCFCPLACCLFSLEL